MYEPIWKVVAGEIKGEGAKSFAQRIWQHARWNTIGKMQETAQEIVAIMWEIGLKDIELINYPADGVTNYGGWVMPQAWDVEDAWLEIAEPSVPDPLLARYRNCPHSLMMYSAPTPPEGVVAEVVVVDEANREASYEGLDLVGKLALIDSIGIGAGMHALERGAVGLISDAIGIMGTPSAKTGDYLERAIQFHNYTIPPWRWGQKGFGFSIPPAIGRRLRELVRDGARVKLRAMVRSRLYDGKLPLVTGLMPGRTDEEIVITAHLCEPGANDNASGCALGLEVIRLLQVLVKRGKLEVPERGIRLIYSFEGRGYQAFLATYPHLHRFIAGINLDMVGNDLSDARATCNVVFNFPSLPAYTDALAVELADRLKGESPLFRYRTHSWGLVDNLFGEPSIGAPMCVIGSWPDAYYHTSLDTPETLSPTMLRQVGQLAATYCYFLADAGFEEAVWLVHAVVAHAEREMQAASKVVRLRGPASGSDNMGGLAQKNMLRLRSIAKLVGEHPLLPTEDGLRRNGDWLCPWSHLFKDEELQRYIEEMCERVRDIANHQQQDIQSYLNYATRAGSYPPAFTERGTPSASLPYPPAEGQRAKRLVPRRAYVGAFCFESLNPDQLRELRGQKWLDINWGDTYWLLGVPYWLQMTAFLSNGRRTALDIWQLVRRESEVSLAQLNDAIEFLARNEFVRLRVILTKDDFLAAFKQLGLEGGEVVMAHSSLSMCGFVDGGVDAVIDALLEAIGPHGTLVMPTLSFSWIGRPPYDLRQTPSQVGAITEAFRKRPGVLRSPHPTHSVAAYGPRAKVIVSGHTPDRPVFGEDGAYGKLYELDARVLMLAPLGTNTIMHMAEERAGVPFPDFQAHVMKDGTRHNVTVKRAPWHANFEEHYRILFERGLIRSTALGEDEVHYMRARDAVDVALENVRRNPMMVTDEGCSCDFCQSVRIKFAG